MLESETLSRIISVGIPLAAFEIVTRLRRQRTCRPRVGRDCVRYADRLGPGIGRCPKLRRNRYGLWYRTGDAGVLADECYLYLRDRIKERRIAGGRNLSQPSSRMFFAINPAGSGSGRHGVADAALGGVVQCSLRYAAMAQTARTP